MDQIGYKKQMKGHLYISVRKREKKKGGEEKNPLELSHRSPICTSSPNRKRMTRCFKRRSRRRCMHYLKGISGAHSVACAKRRSLSGMCGARTNNVFQGNNIHDC